jgi:DNA mismatch repair protein MutS2
MGMNTASSFRLPLTTRRDLDFDTLEAIWVGLCKTPYGPATLKADLFVHPASGLEKRRRELAQATEWMGRRGLAVLADVESLEGVLEEAERARTLDAHTLAHVARSLKAAMAARRAVLVDREIPDLHDIVEEMHDWGEWADEILGAMDENGNLRDDASPALAEERARLRNLQQRMRQSMEKQVAEYEKRGFLQEAYFTLRNDRYVLPIVAEHKRHIDGIVHDASQTGQTFFIEPRALFDLGNQIAVAQAAVRTEEARLLERLTKPLVEDRQRVVVDMNRLGTLDARLAIGLFMSTILADHTGARMVPPKEGELFIEDAIHPLLAWQSLAEGSGTRGAQTLMPNTFSLKRGQALIVSGPNAGGKTVALKTLGLHLLFCRAGIPLPAKRAAIPEFRAVVGRIGDQQTLSGGESTFTAEARALAEICVFAEDPELKGRVIVLLDELLSSTDAAEGAALAQATVERLTETGAMLFVTTHHHRLKLLGVDDNTPAFRSAFFTLTQGGEPTFLLDYDGFGSSDALKMARRVGLDEGIVRRAETLLMGADDEKEASAMQALLDERESLAQEVKNAQEESRRLQGLLAQERDKAQRVGEKLDALRAQKSDEALAEVKKARAVVKKASAQLQSNPDARVLNDLSHALIESENHLSRASAHAHDAPRKNRRKRRTQKAQEGDRVVLDGHPDIHFDVIKVDDGVLTVSNQRLRMRVGQEKIVRVLKGQKGREGAKNPPRPQSPSGPDLTSADSPRTRDNTLDLRGERVHEALVRMEAFFDAQMARGNEVVYVLHGHGTGALKKAVRESLDQNAYAADFRPGERSEGGDGVTRVQLGAGR